MKTNFILILSLFVWQSVFASEVFFEKDPSLPLVRISVVFKGGSAMDPDQKNGVTDITAKLMLRGTKSKTKNQIDLLLDQLGGTILVNTHAEYVAFSGSVLGENITPFLQLMTEILTSPSFRSVELEKLKKEQMSSIQDALGQDRELAKLRYEQIFFKGHPYAKANRGKVADIKNLQLADVQSQYEKLIQDSQMLVLATGDTSQSSLDPLIQEFKDKRNTHSGALTPIQEFKNYPKKMRVVIIDKPDRTQTQIVIGQRGVKINSPEVDALMLANHAFGGGGFMSRLMIELRVKRGWTYGAGSVFKFGAQPHSWRAMSFPKNSDTPATIVETLKMIRELKEHGLTKEEFEFAKQSLVNGAGFTYNTPGKRLENAMVEKLYGLPPGYHRDMAKRISALTLEEVNQTLAKFITPDQLLIAVVGTASVSKKAIADALKIPENEIEVQDYMKE